MAVKLNMDHWVALKRIGVPTDQIEWLKSSGVKVALTTQGISFSVPSVSYDGAISMQYVEMKLQDIINIKSGTLLPSVADCFKNKAVEVIENIKTVYGLYLESLPVSKKLPGTLGKLPPISGGAQLDDVLAKNGINSVSKAGSFKSKVFDLQPGSDPKNGWPMFDMSKIKTADMVKLRDATHMYQPVKGTSGGSRYFVVGANADLRVAARLNGKTLSVRIEGPNWEQHKKSIQAVGFSKLSKSASYASVHFDVGEDFNLANKTLGAVLTGLAVDLETPIPNLALIK